MKQRLIYTAINTVLSGICLNLPLGFAQMMSNNAASPGMVIEMKASMSEEHMPSDFSPGNRSQPTFQSLSLMAGEPVHGVTQLRNQLGDGYAYAIANQESGGCLGPVSSGNGFVHDDAPLRTTKCYLSGDGGLRNSQNPFSQFFYYTDEGQFQSASNYGYCLEVESGAYQTRQPVVFKRCNSNQIAQRFVYEANTGHIKPTENNAYCLAIEGGGGNQENRVFLWDCSASDKDQRWQIKTAQVARIKNKARGNYVAVGSANIGRDDALVTWPSDKTDRWLDQYWVFGKYANDTRKSILTLLSPFTDKRLCTENGYGGVKNLSNGDGLTLFTCSPKNREDQQLVLTDEAYNPSGWGHIHIDGRDDYRVAIAGEDDIAGAGLIFWKSSSTDNDQKFRVDPGTGIFALFNRNYEACLSVPEASADESVYSMTCGLRMGSNTYHQYFEVYKDGIGNYIFASMMDNNLCLSADNIYSRVILGNCSAKDELSDDFKWQLGLNGSLRSIRRDLCLDISDNSGRVMLEECNNSYGQAFMAMKAPVPSEIPFQPEYLCRKNTQKATISNGSNQLPQQYRQAFHAIVNAVEVEGLRENLLDIFRMAYLTDPVVYLEEIMNMLRQLGYSDNDQTQGGRMLRTIQQAMIIRKDAIADIMNSGFGREFRHRFWQKSNPYDSYGVATLDDFGYAGGIAEFAEHVVIPLRYMLLNMNGITNISRGISVEQRDRLTRLAVLALSYSEVHADIAAYTNMLSQRKDYGSAVRLVQESIIHGNEYRVQVPDRETLQDEPDCE